MVLKVIASTDQPITFPMDGLTPWSYTQGIKDFFLFNTETAKATVSSPGNC